MGMKIIKQDKNVFLNRDEYLVEIEAEIAPSVAEVVKFLGKGEDVTVVKKIRGGFGKHKFVAEVDVYENRQVREEVEKIPRAMRKKMEEAQASEKKEVEVEKPAEEVKEEKHVEKVGDSDTKLPKAEEKKDKIEEKIEDIKEKIEDGN